MGAAVVNIRKASVTSPDGPIHNVRFIFHNGSAAVWRDETTSATRLLFAQGAVFEKSYMRTKPHIVTLEDGSVWKVKALPGGGCGCKPSATKNIGIEVLLDPEIAALP